MIGFGTAIDSIIVAKQFVYDQKICTHSIVCVAA